MNVLVVMMIVMMMMVMVMMMMMMKMKMMMMIMCYVMSIPWYLQCKQCKEKFEANLTFAGNSFFSLIDIMVKLL